MKKSRPFLYSMTILAGLFTVNISAFAQLQGPAKIDSMLTVLPKQKEDTNKVKLLIDISINYTVVNPDEGLKFAQKGLDLSSKLGWKIGISKGYTSLGINYEYKGDYPTALDNFFKSLKLIEDIKDKRGIAELYGDIGNVYSATGKDIDKALEYHLKALKLDEEIGNKKNMMKDDGNIGSVYEGKQEYEKALDYEFRAFKLAKEFGFKQAEAAAYGNIGSIYMQLHLYSKGLAYFFKGLKIDEALGNKYYIGIAMGNIGSAYVNMVTENGIVNGADKFPDFGDKIGSPGRKVLCYNSVKIA